MEVMKLVCYKNWSIKIDCERTDDNSSQATFAAIAIATYIGRDASTGKRPAGGPFTTFMVSLPRVAFHTSHEANLAVQQETKDQIDNLCRQSASWYD